MENNRKPDVIQAVMKVMRSMRRHPPMGEGFPPEVGRTLGIMAENDGVMSFGDTATLQLIDELKALDVNGMTPIQAMSRLDELTKLARSL